MTVSVDEPVVVTWEAVDVDNGEGIGSGVGRSWSRGQGSSPNVRILLSSADFGEVTTWGTITNSAQGHRFWVGNSGDGSLVEEVALHEGVDSSFVMVGNRMRNNLFSTTGLGGSSGDLELQTNGGLGETYYVYLAIDDGRDGSVGDAVVASVPQSTNFGGYSPVVRVPGRVTFVGTVPASPATGNRLIVPTRMETTAGEAIKYPIFPEVTPTGKRIRVVDIFLSVDADKFEAIDMDPASEGIQPFTIGDNSQIIANNIDQGSYVEGDKLRLDLIYSDQVVGGGLTFFDGEQALATANLRALAVEDSATVFTTITLDDTGQRVTKMLDENNVSINAGVPAPTEVSVNRRGSITGRVPLQSRETSADTVTFYLRGVGSYAALDDSLFETNDIDPETEGVQVITTGRTGEFSLDHVPSGRYVLAAYAPRYLAGHDTVFVKRSLDIAEVTPTLDGDGVQRTHLLAGDAAGYVDSTGATLPDNFIGSDDINAVNDALFTQPGDSLYNTYADFNRDGVINATDKDYAAANQTDNTGAANEIRPVFPTFKVAQGTNADALIRFADLPDGEIRPGETFDVTAEIRDARAVRTYEIHILFDPDRLEVVDLVSTGSLLSNYLTDVTAKVTDGDLGLVNSVIGRTPIGASGGGSLATVRFRAVSRSAETRLTLSDAMLIDVSHVGLTPKLDEAVTLVLSRDPIVYHDAAGDKIRGLILPEEDPRVDFNDFVAFAKTFGATSMHPDYELRADMNGDTKIDFADFVIFAGDFGRVAVDAPTSAGLYKPVDGPGGSGKADARYWRPVPFAPQGWAQKLMTSLLDTLSWWVE
jgi:hypothetical protein